MQRKVRVTVEGSDRIGVFQVDHPAAFILVHEDDLSRLIENTKKLVELRNAR